MTPDKKEPIIKMQNIYKSFGGIRALKDFNFSIYKNDCIGLVGDNGAGKSTVIKILSGVYPPDKGKIFADGKEVRLNSHLDAIKIGIETIYQDAAVIDQMDTARNLFLGREIRYPLGFRNSKEMDNITLDILDTIGIKGINSPGMMVEELSGGQKQSIALARALHFKNRIILFDEPTNALSLKESRFVYNFISQIKEEGLSCVYVTHNIFLAYSFVDRFVILSHGEIVGDFLKKETTVEEIIDIVLSR